MSYFSLNVQDLLEHLKILLITARAFQRVWSEREVKANLAGGFGATLAQSDTLFDLIIAWRRLYRAVDEWSIYIDSPEGILYFRRPELAPLAEAAITLSRLFENEEIDKEVFLQRYAHFFSEVSKLPLLLGK